MSRTIGEGEAVIAAIKKHQRIFRLNTWFRFQDGFYGMGTPVQPIKKAVMNGLFGWPLKVTLNANTGFRLEVLLGGQNESNTTASPSGSGL